MVILSASQAGFPLSTTQVTAGGVMGAGVGKKAADVRWTTTRSMVAAWLVTLPAAAATAAALYALTDALGTELAGPLAVSLLAGIGAAALFVQAQRSNPVTANDV